MNVTTQLLYNSCPVSVEVDYYTLDQSVVIISITGEFFDGNSWEIRDLMHELDPDQIEAIKEEIMDHHNRKIDETDFSLWVIKKNEQ